jgi:tyrosine-specific transport protein
MSIVSKKNIDVISAMFLVAGTCIGGGMLALPAGTGVTGFVPSMSMMVLCWAMMTFTGLLFIEVTLTIKDEVHVMTIADRLLGRPGKILAWIIFPFISYASIVAYTAGGGITVSNVIASATSISLTKLEGSFIFILLFGIFTGLGTWLVTRLNDLLFICMIGAYLLLIAIGGDEVKFSNLERMHWTGAHMAIPLLLTSFSHQAFLIPTLTTYLKRDVIALKWAVVGGTTLALLVYGLWQWLVLGAVPVDGPYGLEEALRKGEPATEYLRQAAQSKWVSAVSEFFAFFALVTSFIGMSLGLYDFLSDSLKVPKKGLGLVGLMALVIIPSYLFVAYFERAFLVAMDISGGFGDTILNGIMPIFMVWILRYRQKLGHSYQVSGGKFALLAVLAFYSFVLLLELLKQLGLVNSLHEIYIAAQIHS